MKFFQKLLFPSKPSIQGSFARRTIQLNHCELTVEFKSSEGSSNIIDFKTPLISSNNGKIIFPKVWVSEQGSITSREFIDILVARLPYQDRKESIKRLNILLEMIYKRFKYYNSSLVHDHLLDDLNGYLGKEWRERLEILNIFLEGSVEWLQLKQKQFYEIHSPEPELKLTDAEYERLRQQLLQ